MTKEQAIKLYESGWWKSKTHREIAELQMAEELLCCPFSVFHQAVEKTLGRPVYTHEFALGYEGLKKELYGERKPPSLAEVFNSLVMKGGV